jgi:hypothetical protein
MLSPCDDGAESRRDGEVDIRGRVHVGWVADRVRLAIAVGVRSYTQG